MIQQVLKYYSAPARSPCCCPQEEQALLPLLLAELLLHVGRSGVLWVLIVHPVSLEHSSDKIIEPSGGILWKD